MLHSIKSSEDGYTLAELNTSVLIMGIIMVSIFAIFTNYFVQLTRTNHRLEMNTDAQALLRVVTEELRYGAGVRQTNTIDDPSLATTPPNEWNTNNSAFVIITAVPATDSNNDLILNPDTGRPYLNELVYYKQGSTMYKRTLANTNATGNTYKTSCPTNLASASCPADIKLVNNVDTMNFTLYDQDDLLTSDPLLARSVIISLNMERDTFGTPLTLQNTIRTTLRNTF